MAGEDLRRVDPGTEFSRTAHQIGVDMRFENVGNRNVLLPRQLYVFIDIRRRIENSRDARAVISKKIRQLCDSFGFNAFEA